VSGEIDERLDQCFRKARRVVTLRSILGLPHTRIEVGRIDRAKEHKITGGDDGEVVHGDVVWYGVGKQ
jgi:hypothetical protein